MTHSMLCESVAHLLEAWHDGELPLEQQVAVESHLAVCASCSATAHELQEVRQVLQAQLHEEVNAALDRTLDSASRSVISQVAAERAVAWSKGFRALFEDLHLVWAGLAASGATVTCILLIGAVLHFAPARRDDSLSGLITALAAPGSNRNPVQLDEQTELPRVGLQGFDHPEAGLKIAKIVARINGRRRQNRITTPALQRLAIRAARSLERPSFTNRV